MLTYFSIATSVIALLFVVGLIVNIIKKPQGTKEMKEIAGAIHEGSIAFLKQEYKIIAIFVFLVAILLCFLEGVGYRVAISFLSGAIFSAIAGNIGMQIATRGNIRTAWAAKKGINRAFKIALTSGAIMGLSVVSLGVLGIAILYLIFKDPVIIYGFGFGASSIALFARVGGGIFTKSADVGADLVGKIEQGIPEDDPRNPAVIADNVGDNVGDVAGMGADLFESYVDSIIAAMVLGVAFVATTPRAVILPLVLASIGIIASILGFIFISIFKKSKPHKLLNYGTYGAAGSMVIMSYFAIRWMGFGLNIFWPIIVGLGSGLIIGLATEYYTSARFKPTRNIAKSSEAGPATNIIEGLSVGMFSTLIPVVVIAIAISLSFEFAGLYGVAIAAVGMLSTLGITLASDSYGPVADNAAGIAEMAHMGSNIRKRTEALDAVGNTTAAIGKGFAVGSAALTALVLTVSYTQIVGLKVLDLQQPNVIIGLFIGGLLPFLFCAFTMKAVGKSAFKIVEEVRRQFREIKGLKEGKSKPDYKRCIAISTKSALRQMILPSLLAIITPVFIGFLLGPEALGGLLCGTVVTGFLLAVMMANAGGAWDNAKKYVEAGNLGGKGSDTHKAAVVGDTVGDPFKDTSGPSLNILIKLMSIIALIVAPLL
jgi:K(+)-stimulated pyrophosphate-energized sodium pump